MDVSLIIALLAALGLVKSDIYMHNPRGSNNRLNEKSAQRDNANRVFDSQNNDRGGYNVGDRSDKAANNEAEQYQMIYFQSSHKKGKVGASYLSVEWTNQHGCGGNEDDNPHKLNCQLVLQYMCQPDVTTGEKIRDGTSRATQNYQAPNSNEKKAAFKTRKRNQVQANRAYQESFEWYDKCQVRDRNKGLFIATSNLKGENAKYTRQNPNGNRRGYECPEERDYYPYWHPTVWKDIGVYAENKSMCPYYQSESYNVHSKWECSEKWEDGTPKHYSKYNNKIDCKKHNGEWLEYHNYLEKAPSYKSKEICEKQSKQGIARYIWARPIYGYEKECLVALDAPFCEEAPFSRDNHLGDGADLGHLNMTWRIPHFPSGETQKCILRIRYNISTDDYDPYHTNASFNGIRNSPISQNPEVDIGAQNKPLRLAINVAQYGRTFQDRSHVFLLKPRPSGGAAGNLDNRVIHNLNVRGKRGNIVQTYPAVEYDFIPTDLKIKENDLVHIQWTGSNTHNNGNPGGDGQTGDDGQGTGGTDRNNMVGLADRLYNFPLDMDDPKNLFNHVKSVKWTAVTKQDPSKLSGADIAVQFSSVGYYQCVEKKICGVNSLETKSGLDKLLNNAPASFGGMVLEFRKGTYHFMCTRNNNFSNRSQKGTLIVS